MGLPEGFKCPAAIVPLLEQVFDGEYDIAGLPAPKIVLDIGANYGAFTWWASERYPGCEITAYEPCAATFQGLMANIPPHANVMLQKRAVSTKGKHAFLRYGRNHPGESSLYDLGDQLPEGERVECVHPKDLPLAHFIKIDTEGAEADILHHYPYLSYVQAVVLEWHRSCDIEGIIEMCSMKNGLKLCYADARNRVLKFKRDNG